MGFAANYGLGEEFAVLGVLYADHKGAGVVVVLLPFGGGVGAPAYAHDGAAAFVGQVDRLRAYGAGGDLGDAFIVAEASPGIDFKGPAHFGAMAAYHGAATVKDGFDIAFIKIHIQVGEGYRSFNRFEGACAALVLVAAGSGIGAIGVFGPGGAAPAFGAAASAGCGGAAASTADALWTWVLVFGGVIATA